MSPRSEKPRLLPLDTLPQTPPPNYTPTQTHRFTFPSSSTQTPPSNSYFSPITREKETREVIMGGLVTPGRRSLEWDGDEEKGLMERSIEVPGIVLTEPIPDLPPRSPSPPLKQILLLPPTSLPIPHPSQVARRKSSALGLSTIRTMVLLLLLAVGGWHLWSVAGSGEDQGTGF